MSVQTVSTVFHKEFSQGLEGYLMQKNSFETFTPIIQCQLLHFGESLKKR